MFDLMQGSRCDIITKWASNHIPLGDRDDTVYPLRNPISYTTPCTILILKISISLYRLPLSISHFLLYIFSILFPCLGQPYIYIIHVIFFKRRNVRANITTYAYLYRIKNHPPLKCMGHCISKTFLDFFLIVYKNFLYASVKYVYLSKQHLIFRNILTEPVYFVDN